MSLCSAVRVAVWCPPPGEGEGEGPTEPWAAAVRIHGVFATWAAAQAAVRALAEEEGDAHASSYVLEGVGRWLPVLEPVPGITADDEEVVGGGERGPRAREITRP